MTMPEPMSDPAIDLALLALSARDQIAVLTAPAVTTRPVVLFSDLIRYLEQPHDPRNQRVVAALSTDLSVRRSFTALVESRSRLRMSAIRAAKDEEINHRLGEGWRITFTRSRAQRNQIYVGIEVADSFAFAQETLALVAIPEGADVPLVITLPALVAGKYQLVLAEGDPLLDALRHLDSQVMLVQQGAAP